MPSTGLKRVEKIFEATGYRLIIYYHKDLSVKDIYNKIILKDSYLKGQGFEPETKDTSVAYTLTNNNGTSIIIINSRSNLAQIHHECVHITMEIFEFMDASHTESTDEVFAYYSQHVFEFIVKLMIGKFGVPAKNLLDF